MREVCRAVLGVLFVLLTFLFMAHWHNSPWGSKKGWMHLALSGVFMGCAVASKWNGAYPMIALAVLFFISLVFKYKTCDRTKADKAYLVATLGIYLHKRNFCFGKWLLKRSR